MFAAAAHALREWDALARAWVVVHRHPALDGVMWTLSAASRGGMIWLFVDALIAWRRARWRDFAALVLAVLLATIVARVRPFVASPAVLVIGGRPHDASFPSGHAANAFASALILSTTVPRGRIVWWPVAAAIAYSRIYLGVHYPLDVIGGAFVGLVCAALVIAVRAVPSRFRRAS